MVLQVANSFLGIVLLSAALAAQGASPGSVEEHLSVAEQKYAEAQAAGFAWRANRISLEAARQALTDGDEDKALALIEESIQLAEASLAQAAREAEDWQSRAPFGGP